MTHHSQLLGPVNRESEGAMPYTLWSKGRLVATSDLGFAQCFPNWRSGWLEPVQGSNQLIERATAVSPAMRQVSRRVRALAGARGANGRVDPESEELRGSTEYADLQEALHAEAALELELRGPDGAVIPTVDIGIKDTSYIDPAGAAKDGDPWEPAWPRYQVIIELPEGVVGEYSEEQ